LRNACLSGHFDALRRGLNPPLYSHDGAIEATVVLLSTYDGAVVEGGMTLQLAAEGTMAPGGQILSSGWQTASGTVGCRQRGG
jgi:hypothetical protein